MADVEADEIKRPKHFLCLTMELNQSVVFHNPARVRFGRTKRDVPFIRATNLNFKHSLFTFLFGLTFIVELNTLVIGTTN